MRILVNSAEQQIPLQENPREQSLSPCKIQEKYPTLPQPIKEWAESFPQPIAA